MNKRSSSSKDIAIQYKPLRLAPSSAEYALYKAALEYDLIEPIVIETRQDMRSERKWKDRIEPFQHQVSNLINFCRRLPVTMLADDVGLGKTISAGLIASELISRHKVSKILIVCPKLLIPQWKEELDFKFGIKSVEAIGRDVIDARPPEPAGAVITTYQTARIHLDEIAKTGFEMLILDEAHKLRNLFGVDTPPAVAKRFRQALADRTFKYVVMLTATPIQNRLWDLYSLIDLLTVARGHENPFGSQLSFSRRFIADKQDQARKLRPEMRDEFRSIVYGYMSRVRRADAKLYFPTRKIQMSRVSPTIEELELFKLISEPIQKMNRLAQISIAQALVSSPQALVSQLENMAEHKTVPEVLARDAKSVLARIKTTAKLEGLGALIEGLSKERPADWRAVVFTSRRETQGAIAEFLEGRQISYGVINGDSGHRNQETIGRFKSEPPGVHVIISTEAGSEGVNLQAANVVVNYDLPWNPMIVEQRIGRVQRLASNHANVIVFNVVLAKTFEEYIVGRLMEKLQMASHAIGDVESLLEAAGMEEDEGPKGFQEKLRELVMSSIAGKDTEKATRLTEQSIAEAKDVMEKEEQNINTILGSMNGEASDGPRAPKLPPLTRSMDPREFVLSALGSQGALVSLKEDGTYVSELNGSRELLCFDDGKQNSHGTLYAPGSPPFERLVGQVATQGLHLLTDVDSDPARAVDEVVNTWVSAFGGKLTNRRIEETWRGLAGSVLLRVRVTVAHDSYERLLEIPCNPDDNRVLSREGLGPFNMTISDPTSSGLSVEAFSERVLEDPSVQEFCRFYRERLAHERASTGQDERRWRKLEDDLTPRIAITVVGINGSVRREVKVKVIYSVGSETLYESTLIIQPSTANITVQPNRGTCTLTGVTLPKDCLASCAISGKEALRHLLVKSEISNRVALPEFTAQCAISGKKILADEIEVSGITGKPVAKGLLKTSSLSGRKGEPEFFTTCGFTSAEVLKDELLVSQVSGKPFRVDQKSTSAVSGKIGHQSEFIRCAETKEYLLPTEAEHCEVTQQAVVPGLLKKCEVTGKRVIPRELEVCNVTGKKALKTVLVSSSVSGVRLLKEKAICASTGTYCNPNETITCLWSGEHVHPDDIRTCSLTGIQVHSRFLLVGDNCLAALAYALDGVSKKTDADRLWGDLTAALPYGWNKARCRVESAELSPDSKHIAACVEVRTWIGLKVRQAGTIYSIPDRKVVGRVVMGKRDKDHWRSEAN